MFVSTLKCTFILADIVGVLFKFALYLYISYAVWSLQFTFAFYSYMQYIWLWKVVTSNENTNSLILNVLAWLSLHYRFYSCNDSYFKKLVGRNAGPYFCLPQAMNNFCWFLFITMKLATENLQNVAEATSRHLCQGFILNLNVIPTIIYNF